MALPFFDSVHQSPLKPKSSAIHDLVESRHNSQGILPMRLHTRTSMDVSIKVTQVSGTAPSRHSSLP